MGKKMVNVSQNSNMADENIISMDQSKLFTTKKSQKLKKSDHCGQKEAVTNCEASFPQLELQDNVEVQVQASARLTQNADNCKEIIDLELSPQKGSG